MWSDWAVHGAGMFMDTRAQAKRVLGTFDEKERHGILKTAVCLFLALGVVFLPGLLGWEVFAGLNAGAKSALGIMVFAAALWVSEAMPAFAVALLVIGLQIAILGNPGGVWAEEGDTRAWTTFVEPWASPTMWLFLGGFVLAHGCSTTQLDKWLAGMVLGRFATSPAKLVASVMGITFLFSMFMSNTATAAMMIAVIAPVLAGLPRENRMGKGMVLAVAAGANLGGVGTMIGTPPNAIAAGQLSGEVDFVKWIMFALPPALFLAAAVYFLIWRIYIKGEAAVPIHLDSSVEGGGREKRHRVTVMLIFSVTVALWMSESLTGIPSSVVSFIPIVGLAVSGVIGAKDMRVLPWDVLLLLAGGLSLGVGVEVTGLASWIAGQVPSGLGVVAIAAVFGVMGIFLSNLMSNTAAAALLIPLGSSLAAGTGGATLVVVVIAISCSAAMALPISTPPNAIAYGTERLSSRDFLLPGLLVAVGLAGVLPWLMLFF